MIKVLTKSIDLCQQMASKELLKSLIGESLLPDKKEYENILVFLMSVEKARFRNPVVPDCKLELNIEAIRSHGRVWKNIGEAFVDGKKMADAQWSATIVDRK